MAEKRRRAPKIRAEYIDRSKWSGFKSYWEHNPIMFEGCFGDMTIEEAWEDATGTPVPPTTNKKERKNVTTQTK